MTSKNIGHFAALKHKHSVLKTLSIPSNNSRANRAEFRVVKNGGLHLNAAVTYVTAGGNVVPTCSTSSSFRKVLSLVSDIYRYHLPMYGPKGELSAYAAIIKNTRRTLASAAVSRAIESVFKMLDTTLALDGHDGRIKRLTTSFLSLMETRYEMSADDFNFTDLKEDVRFKGDSPDTPPYRVFSIKKPSGGFRVIHAGTDSMKALQADLLQGMYEVSGKDSFSDDNLAYIPGKSFVSALKEKKLSQQYELSIDLKNYYHQINNSRLLTALVSLVDAPVLSTKEYLVAIKKVINAIMKHHVDAKLPLLVPYTLAFMFDASCVITGNIELAINAEMSAIFASLGVEFQGALSRYDTSVSGADIGIAIDNRVAVAEANSFVAMTSSLVNILVDWKSLPKHMLTGLVNGVNVRAISDAYYKGLSLEDLLPFMVLSFTSGDDGLQISYETGKRYREGVKRAALNGVASDIQSKIDLLREIDIKVPGFWEWITPSPMVYPKGRAIDSVILSLYLNIARNISSTPLPINYGGVLRNPVVQLYNTDKKQRMVELVNFIALHAVSIGNEGAKKFDKDDIDRIASAILEDGDNQVPGEEGGSTHYRLASIVETMMASSEMDRFDPKELGFLSALASSNLVAKRSCVSGLLPDGTRTMVRWVHGLPQGSKTSSFIAAAMSDLLIKKVRDDFVAAKAKYTRIPFADEHIVIYSDNLYGFFNAHSPRGEIAMKKLIRGSINSLGLEVNEKKTRVFSGDTKKILGVIIDSKGNVRIPRSRIYEINQIIINLVKSDSGEITYKGHVFSYDDMARLKGLAEWAKNVGRTGYKQSVFTLSGKSNRKFLLKKIDISKFQRRSA